MKGDHSGQRERYKREIDDIKNNKEVYVRENSKLKI